MKIQLTKGQIQKLVEQKLFYGDERLPQIISEISKDIESAKKVCSLFLSRFRNLCIDDIVENPEKHFKQIREMESTHKLYSKKSNEYYSILETFDTDFDNKQLMKFDKLNSMLDTMQDDMDTLIDSYKNVLEMFVDDRGNSKDKMRYFIAQYPPETIDTQDIKMIANRRV